MLRVECADRWSRTERRLDLLVTPAFVGVLVVLLLNDLVLKARYGNWLTGKLSDVAGLFVFALFLTAFLPTRRVAIHLGTALLFLWWKSPLSTSVLDAWNATGVWPLERVVDYTDWMAIAVLPLAWRHARHASGTQRLRRARPAVVVVTIFAIVATSQPFDWEDDGTVYVVPLSRARTLEELHALADSLYYFHVSENVLTDAADSLTVKLHFDMIVSVELRTAATGETIVTLIETGSRGSGARPPDMVRSCFVSVVIRPLREVARSGRRLPPTRRSEDCTPYVPPPPPPPSEPPRPRVVNVARDEVRGLLTQLGIPYVDMSYRGAIPVETIGVSPMGPVRPPDAPAMIIELRDAHWGATEITLVSGSTAAFGDPVNVPMLRQAFDSRLLHPLRALAARRRARPAPRP